MPSGIYERTEKHIDRLKEANNSGWFKKGHGFTKEQIEKIRKKLKGKKLIYRNPIQRGINISKAKKGVKHLNQRGEKCHLWKGGITPKNTRIRMSIEYRLWREAVFARDNWTCQNCGKRDGGYLHAHHIKPFSTHPKLRVALNNGLTLCKKCHLIIHSK